MSIFTRAELDAQKLSTGLDSLADRASVAPGSESDKILSALDASAKNLSAMAKKYLTKVSEGEKDPNKKLYGAAMVDRINRFVKSVSESEEKLAVVRESVEAVLAKEATQRAKEEEAEKQKKMAEEEVARKQAEAEAEALRAKENARMEKQKAEEAAAAKKRAEEEALKLAKEQAEKAAAATITKEEESSEMVNEDAMIKKLNFRVLKALETSTDVASYRVGPISPDSLVLELKELIEALGGGAPAKQQRLVVKGVFLDNSKSLEDCGLAGDEEIFALRLPDGYAAADAGTVSSKEAAAEESRGIDTEMAEPPEPTTTAMETTDAGSISVTVRSTSSRDTYSIHPSSTVKLLKEMVEKATGVPADDLSLVLEGKVLNNEATLEAKGVKNGSVVYSMARKRLGSTTGPPEASLQIPAAAAAVTATKAAPATAPTTPTTATAPTAPKTPTAPTAPTMPPTASTAPTMPPTASTAPTMPPTASTAPTAPTATTPAPRQGSSSAPKMQPPSGHVYKVTMGDFELDEVLRSCGTSRLAIVDYSAAWCGPCRRIAPVLENMASNNLDVTFIGVDSEASPENKATFVQKGIQAMPTFHFYVNGTVMYEVKGAREDAIEEAINRYRSATASSSMGAGTVSITANVMKALQTLKTSISPADFHAAASTIITYVSNAADHPSEAKYRKIRVGNEALQRRVGRHPSGLECIIAFGFQRQMLNGEEYLVLSEQAALNPELKVVRDQLSTALQGASNAQGVRQQTSTTASTPTSSSAAPTTTAAPVVATVPDEGGQQNEDGTDDEEEQQLLQEAMLLSLQEQNNRERNSNGGSKEQEK